MESEKVKTAFFQVGQAKIELLASTDEKKGEGLHHLAFAVPEILKQK